MNRLLFIGLLLFCSSNMASEVPVTVSPLEAIWKPLVYDAPATVIATSEPQISSKINAEILSVQTKEGDLVEPGEVIVELDCRSYRIQRQTAAAELKKADVRLAFARAQLTRAKNLESKKSISEELLDQRKTELATAKADRLLVSQQLASTELNLSYCQVEAPYRSLVTARHVSKGDYVATSQPLLTLMKMDGHEVEARLQYHEIQTLESTSDIRFVSDTGSYTVALRTVIPVFDRQTATARVRLEFTGNEKAWPGDSGRLLWDSGKKMIPATYLLRRDRGLGVFYLEGSDVKFTVLDDAVEGSPSLINLPPDARIIIEGRQRLHEGEAVKVMTSQD